MDITFLYTMDVQHFRSASAISAVCVYVLHIRQTMDSVQHDTGTMTQPFQQTFKNLLEVPFKQASCFIWKLP